MTSDKRSYEYSTFSSLIMLFLSMSGHFALFLEFLGIIILLVASSDGSSGKSIVILVPYTIFLVLHYSLLAKTAEFYRAGEKPISELLLRAVITGIVMPFIAFTGCVSIIK